MKNSSKDFRVIFWAMAGVLIGAVSLPACKKKKDDTPPPVYATYDITSSPDGKVAGTDSKAAAMVTATYAQATKKMVYKITFTGIDPTSIDIHEGTSTAIGSKLFSLAKNGGSKYTSPVGGEITLTAAQEKTLLKDPATNNIYINFTSAQVTKGEIRGKFTLKRRP